MCRVQLDSKNSPLAMLARTCNSIGKDSMPSKAAHQPLQQQSADKKDNSARMIKSTSPGKKTAATGIDGVTSRKDPPSTSSSTLSRQSSAAAAGRGRLSSSPTSSRHRPCRDAVGGSSRRGDGSRWPAIGDNGPPLSGSPASTSRMADSDGDDSVDELRCAAARQQDRQQQARQTTTSPYSLSDAPPPSLGLYESLRLQQEAAALQAAAVYSPLHQLLAQRHLAAADPLAMYSASLQAAAVVAAAAAQANLGAGRLAGKDYRLVDVLKPCGVDADAISNGEVDGTMFGTAAGMFPLRPAVPPPPLIGHHQPQPYTCSWLVAAGEFCAQRFATSEELFAHLRTHVQGAAAASEDSPLRGAVPLAAASCSAFSPSVSGFLGGQSGVGLSVPAATGTFGGGYGSAASLAAAHAAAAASSFYRGSKVHRSGRSLRDADNASPSSTAAAAAAGGTGTLLFHAAAAAAAASRYHPYKWTPSPFFASQLASAIGAGAGLPGSDLATPAPPVLSAFLQQPGYGALFSAQTLGAAVP